jgi:hypothetical protein
VKWWERCQAQFEVMDFKAVVEAVSEG